MLQADVKKNFQLTYSGIPLCVYRQFWIDLFSKEKQNPFSDSFGFKNPILDFLKKRTLINLKKKMLATPSVLNMHTTVVIVLYFTK